MAALATSAVAVRSGDTRRWTGDTRGIASEVRAAPPLRNWGTSAAALAPCEPGVDVLCHAGIRAISMALSMTAMEGRAGDICEGPVP